MAYRRHRDALPIGYRLLWYELRGLLGQGGFGITYLAQDTNLNQPVAIKEYLPHEFAVREEDSSVHPATGEQGQIYRWGLDRFMKEARTLARFKHPNIVRVLSVFEGNNTAYMLMEYERGEELGARLKRGELKGESELLHVVLPVLDGLALVHEAGFIHRDIKPANLYIREDGSPVLLDFGAARQAVGQRSQALTSLGTAGYAPFEQYSDEGGKQGPWTDIYALGATLYRAVADTTPADALVRSHAEISNEPDPYVPVSKLGVGRYSPHFLEAIDCALRFRERDRPQTAVEWMFMLEGKVPVPPLKSRSLAESAAIRTVTETAIMNRGHRHAGAKDVLASDRAESPRIPPGGQAPPEVARLWVAPVARGAGRAAQRGKRLTKALTGKIPLLARALAGLVIVLALGFIASVYFFETEPPIEEQKAAAQRSPQEQEDLDRQARTAELLALAEEDYRAARFTNPPTENALDRYREVLAAHPGNREATAGISKLQRHFLRLADKAFRGNQFAVAREQLDTAEVIDPDTEAVRQRRAKLDQGEAEYREQREAQRLTAQHQGKIKELLALAQQDWQGDRLSTPPKRNALERYRQVIALDPDNVEAKAGLTRLSERFLKVASKATCRGQFEFAERYLGLAKEVQADSRAVREARGKLTERRQETERQAGRSNIAVVAEKLRRFRVAFQDRDLAKLTAMSRMSPQRVRFLERIFAEYQTVEISISDFSLLSDQNIASATVTIKKLVNKRGDRVIPGESWKQAKIEIRRRCELWDEILW